MLGPTMTFNHPRRSKKLTLWHRVILSYSKVNYLLERNISLDVAFPECEMKDEVWHALVGDDMTPSELVVFEVPKTLKIQTTMATKEIDEEVTKCLADGFITTPQPTPQIATEVVNLDIDDNAKGDAINEVAATDA
ncbi:hypothetical protein E2542_SST09295 [Spatholobus suberectus]|nr:hypothetical protein E2542_SST09295 [Spatholobus suberectus]